MAQDVYTEESSPNTVTLIKGVIQDLERLTQQQLKLFKTELKEEMRDVKQGTISLVLSFGALLVGSVLVGIALAFILVRALDFPDWVSFGLVGLIGLGIGAGLYFCGTREIKSATPLAKESMENLEENLECLAHPKQCPTPSK